MVRTSWYEYLRINRREAKRTYGQEKRKVLKVVRKKHKEVRDLDVVLLKEDSCRWTGGVVVQTKGKTFFYPIVEEGGVEEIPEGWVIVFEDEEEAPLPYEEAEEIYYRFSVAKVVEV